MHTALLFPLQHQAHRLARTWLNELRFLEVVRNPA